MAREFEVIVHGATGFTGRLVAEYLAGPDGVGVRWAMSGRSLAKLESVAREIGADVPLIVADAGDAAGLRAMVDRADVVLSTVGPYQTYGSPLIAACVASGTGYVDLCGEPGWMRDMIDAHGETATATGARIVFSCGFDSVPFDCGVERLQALCVERWGRPAPRVRGRVRAMRGKFSGGTAASLKATLAAAATRPGLAKILASSFGLTPGFTGADQPPMSLPYRDAAIDAWVAPFIMAPINTKNVHRTNLLLGHPWGAEFRYDEMMVVPGVGEVARAAAEALAAANPFGGDKGPKPGEGPSREEREAGHYDLLFLAEEQAEEGGRRLAYAVTGNRDPGYGSTSRMIAEAALCLAREAPRAPGIWTPGALMSEALVARLTARAGLTFGEEAWPG